MGVTEKTDPHGSEGLGPDVYFYKMERIGILTLTWLIGLSVDAQSDRYFPNVSAEFDVAWPCIDPFNGPWTMYWTHVYQAQPDTIMFGLSWGTLQPGSEMGKIAVDGARVLYRGTDGQFVPQDTTLVLYDFDLAIGDTAYWDAYYGFGYTMVTDIDTLTIVGRERRRFSMDNGDQWLEGIGSLMGLFRPYYETPIGCSDPTFTYCANYMDSVAYTICSDLVTEVPEPDGVRIYVHPNPNSGEFTVVSEGEAGPRPWSLHDATGRELRSFRSTGERTLIRLGPTERGLFLLRAGNGIHRIVVE
ncbi:MAG: T9SS type A sorting domain-containing protein [Flavobacteriales bacterium]|nr:T9SS type A sorting domain-containing protein [Flavobacteriales bacterium]